MIDKNKLQKFIMKAKTHTYAGDGEKSASSRIGSVDLKYSDGNLQYLDCYFGAVNFIGEEAVWEAGIPIWGMNYFGKMLIESIPEGFSIFLKDSLKGLGEEAPYRGPRMYEKGNFKYFCSWQGEFSDFKGEEKILYNNEIIYKLYFHGGFLK